MREVLGAAVVWVTLFVIFGISTVAIGLGLGEPLRKSVVYGIKTGVVTSTFVTVVIATLFLSGAALRYLGYL
jgi:hypothetical protein